MASLCVATTLSGSYLPLYDAVCAARRRLLPVWRVVCSDKRASNMTDARWDKIVVVRDLLKSSCETVLWIDADVIVQRPCIAPPPLPRLALQSLVFSVDPHGINSGLFVAHKSAIPLLESMWEARSMHFRSSTPTQDAINDYYRRSAASPVRLARDVVGYGLAPNASYPFWHMTGNRRVKAKRFARLEKSHANPPDARRACSSLVPAWWSWSGI